MKAKIIETYLKTIDQAGFQSLMNHLLYLDGYHFAGSPGSVIGKNKTSQGSPDSFFEDGENFIFCELTTKDRLANVKTFVEKLEKDIDHCFDTAETGIANDKISKVILACTDEVHADELQNLKDRVKKHNTNAELVLYTIQQIPIRLLDYPGLADLYIPGIKTTNGTLYTLPDFLNTTTKQVQPSLTNPFIGRSNELLTIKSLLASTDVLVITGGQGVGKSKLAVQVASNYQSDGYEVLVIAASPVPLWDDLQLFLRPDKKYIVVFDDANKALTNLEYLLTFMINRPDGQIKLIITVRDYLKQDLDKNLRNTKYQRIDIEPLGSVQIQDILRAAIPLGKSIEQAYLEQMANHAKGNARLAMMALENLTGDPKHKVAMNTLELYDDYFKKLAVDLAFISDNRKLRALGVLSFFEVIDFSNLQLMEELTAFFNIDADELHEILLELQQYELVDFYQGVICRMSDQVLGTYTFYKTFIDPTSAVVDYSVWLEAFFDSYYIRVRYTIIDLNNTFGPEKTKTLVQPHLLRFQNVIGNNEERLMQFYRIFWAYLDAAPLTFAGQLTDALPESNPDEKAKALAALDDAKFYIPFPIIDLLQNYWRNPGGYVPEALRIGIRLLLRQPGRTTQVAEALHDSFKYNRHDHMDDYQRQRVYLDWLCTPGQSVEAQQLLDHFFWKILPTLFNWEFFGLFNNGLEQIIHTSRLQKSPGMSALRRMALERFSNLAVTGDKTKIREFLTKYLRPGQGFDETLFADESELVKPIILADYSATHYPDIVFVNEYLSYLEQQGQTIPLEFNCFRKNQLIDTADILLFRPEDFMKGNFDDRENAKDAQMKALAATMDITTVETFFDQAEDLYNQSGYHGNDHWIELSMTSFIEGCFDSDQELYLKAMQKLIDHNYNFAHNLHRVIGYPLFKNVDADRLYAIISSNKYVQQEHWLQLFFEHLPSATPVYLNAFIDLLQTCVGRCSYPDFDFLKRYETTFIQNQASLPNIGPGLDNIFTYVTKLLLSRTTDREVRIDRQLGKKFGTYFSGNPDLLEQVYLFQRLRDKDFDSNGVELSTLLNSKPSALNNLLKSTLEFPGYNETQLYKFDLIWDLSNAEPLVDNAIDQVIAKRPLLMNSAHDINAIFKKRQQGDKREQALTYIRNYITKNQADKTKIAFIFNIISYSYTTEIIPMLKQLLLLNQDIEFVKGLELEPSYVFHGSLAPVLASEAELYRNIVSMVKALPDTIPYVQHIAFWEGQITGLEQSKALAELQDFAGPR